MKKSVTVLLLCSLLCLLLPQPAAAAGSYNPTYKIGLYYSSAALAAANLQNYSGGALGFSVGYWDASRSFVALYELPNNNQLTILKDRDMWVTSGGVYYDMLPSSYTYVIGSIHWQVDTLYTTAAEADAVVQTVRALGYRAFPVCVQNGFRVRIGAYLSAALANADFAALTAATGLTLVLREASSTGYLVTVTGTDEILCAFDYLSQPLGIRPYGELTWFKQHKYYGGFEYNRVSGNNMNVINVVDLDHYVRGVVPEEMSASWPAEALKAEAICAKCYAYNVSLNSRHKSAGFDLCNTDDCQVYGGANKSTAATDAAVDAVSGIYVTYGGKVCQTYYHSTSGGFTEDAKNIWGTDIPYLKAVEDTYLTVFNPYTYTLTIDQISTILQDKNFASKQVVDIYVSRYSAVGNALTLTFVESDGTVHNLSGNSARTALNYTKFSSGVIRVGSHHYTITRNGSLYVNDAKLGQSLTESYAIGSGGTVSKVTVGSSQLQVMTGSGLQTADAAGNGDTYTIKGTGMGHNIGMSQWGAYAMAKRGFTYDEIIKFYFTGVTVGPYEP